ncbi:MAG: serine/threonine protein kinase [Polyangiaceae bacterium]|nr:serine/threonine protein kinase [Polyangiaceae bacterium]
MLHSALPPAEEIRLLPLADIARGGMGIVQLCRATDGRLSGRALAVKRLNPALEEEPEFVNMFLDETWITATINSPHVVRVEAWGRDAEGLFLAVELVEGVSLSRLIKESKEKQEPFAERTVAQIALQVCDGLIAAHELRGENGATLGLVHRDLTPGNVLVSFDGVVKIADFGIAKAEERLTSTRIGMMKGKPAYMAPEQARGGGIDARADLFALGVVIFELLAGRRPWLGNNDLETLVNVTTKEPPDLAEFRKTSSIFTEIVTRCLRKNPNERFGSAAEVKDLLDAWRRERGFDRDDRESLAAFVRRNTQMQQAWFREALGGELQSGGVTFMDLEARIDKGRRHGESSSKHRPVGQGSAPQSSGAPSSGQHAFGPPVARPLATVPMQASGFHPDGQNGFIANLDDTDDDAKTKFLDARAPLSSGMMQAANLSRPGPSYGAPGSHPMSQTGGTFGSTVALTPEEAAAMSSRLVGGVPSSNGPMASGFPGSAPLVSATIVEPKAAGVPRTQREPALDARRRSNVWLLVVLAVLLGASVAVYYLVVRPRLG